MKIVRSAELLGRAQKVIPGGVNSPVRAFKAVGGTPLFIAKAEGPYIWDVDGNRYIDYIGSWGPMLLGHANPAVVAATCEAVKRSSSYGAPTEGEVKLAELITGQMPQVERLRLVNSGTEATMSAIRVARGATGRDAIVKFEGCYHGHADYLLVKAGSGVATFDLPDSPGVPADFAKHTITLPFNNVEALEQLFAERGSELAGVIVEPITGNMGVIAPPRAYLQRMRELCDAHGAVLIFDEVMTGFRVHPGCAQALYNVIPDITAFGKVIGGGMPMGAYGGKAKIMDLVAPAGPVYQAGTLSGNPAAVASGLKTLEQLFDGSGRYANLETRSAELQAGLERALADSGHSGCVQRVGSMITLFFNDGSPVRNFADVKACDHQKFAQFFHGMQQRGMYLPPSGYEAWFISMTHDADLIRETVEAADATLKALN